MQRGRLFLVFFWPLSSLWLSPCSSMYVTYTSDHDICTAVVGANTSAAVCRKAEYFDYFKQLLTSPTQFHIALAQAVLALYDDVRVAKTQPTLTPHPDRDGVSLAIFPIAFGIPEELIVDNVPPKSKPFSRVIPGVAATYFSLPNESLYYEDLSRSLFVLTYKKGGWDCLRHYEILASGALPLFLHISHAPAVALALHPKRLYHLLLQWPQLTIDATRLSHHVMRIDQLTLGDATPFDARLYSAVVQACLQYTRNVFSTRAIAEYVLWTMFTRGHGEVKSPLPTRILYLTHQDHDMDKGDYMTDFLLHGLIQLLGREAVIDFPTRDGLYKTLEWFNYTDFLRGRSKLYGNGFSWGFKLDVLQDRVPPRDLRILQRQVANHDFDVVILGSGHRDGWASKLYLWDDVCRHYNRYQVAFVEGADYHLRKKVLSKYSQCAEHLFSREGYVGGL